MRVPLQRTRWRFEDMRGWFYLFIFIFYFFARSWLLFAVIYNTSTCKRLHPKTCGCCIFVVPLQMHVRRREWVTSNVHTLHHASLPCLWCQSGNVSLCSASVKKKKTTKKKKRKKEQIVPYAHDNYKQCVLCEAFLRICFSSLCKYTPFVVNDYQ